MTETKLTRKDVVKWLVANGRHCSKTSISVLTPMSAYVLPFDLVNSFEVFSDAFNEYAGEELWA